MTCNDGEYEVGYGKPPKGSQFRKGQSGNLKGRLKGRANLATLLERTLEERVVINENGERKTITKGKAAIKRLVNKAVSGDMIALRLFTSLMRLVEEQSEPETQGNSTPAELDQKIVRNLLSRISGQGGGGK